jgi:hypothetical protein
MSYSKREKRIAIRELDKSIKTLDLKVSVVRR